MKSTTAKEISTGILRAIAIITGALALLFFLHKISIVLVYIIIAAILSLIGRPIILFLKNRLKFKNIFAVLTTMGVLFMIILGGVAMFIPLIKTQGENLALLNYSALEQNFNSLYNEIQQYLALHNIDLLHTLQESSVLSKFNINTIPDALNTIVGAIGSFSIGLLSVLFISFFFLKDSKLLQEGILLLVSDNKETQLTQSFNKIKDLLSRYFVGLIIQISILFIIYTIILSIFGIKNAIVIAFLCALLNLIPYVGPLIGGVLMALLSLSSNLGMDFQTVMLPKTIYVMIGYALAQVLDNFVSQPLIFSASVKSHPLEIFLTIIIGGVLFGVMGMIIAVPTYTVIKVISKSFLPNYSIVKKLTKNI